MLILLLAFTACQAHPADGEPETRLGLADCRQQAVRFSARLRAQSAGARLDQTDLSGPAESLVRIRRDIAGDGGTSLTHETVLNASPGQAWAAIATAEGWKSWAVPSAWMDGELLETSYDARASRGGETAIHQQILVKVPERLLVFRTIRAPRGFPGFEAFRRTTHWFELLPEGEGRTRVRLVSAGYPPGAMGSQLADFFSKGNSVSLDRLRRRFETGPIDWAGEQGGAR